ncbi:U32 family peptidase [Gloeobacter kilaueensis]|uniref:Peptidase U32 n=1 Tax=Gloeobacter kilaueensis (strain ATCC BAA-2537 / CCAP 1431/1 / ULC 316 / JS1) TaxID=1183438 RepID=U5QJF3_GLOK1|nr:U32 family peptidase [Gloeobacter kilaueensis]AGY59117.1 peptidase U32 [Gloeobacter kilaueensis JS1]
MSRGERGAGRRAELLAPAGDWECLRAAVENGADAVYFGLERFNARMRAQNFTAADLPELVAFLHRRGVKGYVTFNTLVFADELAEAEQYLRTVIAAGVDGAIVQDIGICRLIRGISPDFPIHASTQMTITSAAGVAFARDLGCDQVVLARECSLAEIAKIQQTAASAGLPLEVFVHGALCVAYSGQCLTSEALGGRSANRGECAQACRMPYELIADGEVVDLGGRAYLLSPQDLCGIALLPELVRSGVASLKIEGRLKSPEYVANITRAYRQALDRIEVADDLASPSAEVRYELEMAFSRGLSTGWLEGTDNQKLVHARFGKKRGVRLGEVLQIEGSQVGLLPDAPVKPGDGVVFDSGRPEQAEEGGRIWTVEHRQDRLWLGFARGEIDWRRVRVGDILWKTSDPQLDRQLRQSFAGDAPRFQRPLGLRVWGRAGELLAIEGRDEAGQTTRVLSTLPLVAAQKQALTDERLAEQLGRLGGTPFYLGALVNQLEGALYLPVSELNRLRRELVEQLLALRSRPRRWQMLPATPACAPPPAAVPAGAPELIVLVRSQEQLDAVLTGDIRTIYCELEDGRQYRRAVQRAHAGGAALWVAPPRIYKPGEDWLLDQVRSSGADGYLVRNYDHLRYFASDPCVGDFSLNIANPLAAAHWMESYGLRRLTASYDLNIQQLTALLKTAPPEWFEITIHQHMPLFHMEHCVFCGFLSEGSDYTNCGRPCERLAVRLRDRVGDEHPLKADAGCRNTVFNARAQSGAEAVHHLRAAGARYLRLEFLDESPEQVVRTIACYRQLLNGTLSGTALWRELQLLNQLGVTRGQLPG